VNLKTALQGLVRAVVEEAERNPDFARKLESSLGVGATPATTAPQQNRAASGKRRTPAVLDPINVARQGEEALRHRLTPLSVEQLKDIVADYGMDPGKLVMKWKTPERIIDRIVEFSLGRAVKGDVFLK
jgi:hypothetical protein